MDYSRNCFSFSVLTLFVLTTLCSAAPPANFQDVGLQKAGEITDKTDSDPLLTSSITEGLSSSASPATSQGDIIITTSSEAIGEQSPSSGDTPAVPSNPATEGQATESSPPPTSDSKTDSASTSSENASPPPPTSDSKTDSASTSSENASPAPSTDTNPTDESAPTTKPSTASSNTGTSGTTEKPETTSPGAEHNGACITVPFNSFGLFLMVFASTAFLLKT